MGSHRAGRYANPYVCKPMISTLERLRIQRAKTKGAAKIQRQRSAQRQRLVWRYNEAKAFKVVVTAVKNTKANNIDYSKIANILNNNEIKFRDGQHWLPENVKSFFEIIIKRGYY